MLPCAMSWGTLPGSMELVVLGLLLVRNLFRLAIFIDRCRVKRFVNGAFSIAPETLQHEEGLCSR